MQKIHSYLSNPPPPPPIILTLDRQHSLKELYMSGYVSERYRTGIGRFRGKLVHLDAEVPSCVEGAIRWQDSFWTKLTTTAPFIIEQYEAVQRTSWSGLRKHIYHHHLMMSKMFARYTAIVPVCEIDPLYQTVNLFFNPGGDIETQARLWLTVASAMAEARSGGRHYVPFVRLNPGALAAIWGNVDSSPPESAFDPINVEDDPLFVQPLESRLGA